MSNVVTYINSPRKLKRALLDFFPADFPHPLFLPCENLPHRRFSFPLECLAVAGATELHFGLLVGGLGLKHDVAVFAAPLEGNMGDPS